MGIEVEAFLYTRSPTLRQINGRSTARCGGVHLLRGPEAGQEAGVALCRGSREKNQLDNVILTTGPNVMTIISQSLTRRFFVRLKYMQQVWIVFK
jgi:hypothetical protein